MTATRTFREGDRVSFTANGGRDIATGIINGVWTEDDADVARVELEPHPFILSAVPWVVDVADLTLVRGVR